MEAIDYIKVHKPLDSLIITMLYFGMTERQVAKRLGVSKQHVFNVVKRSKELLLMSNLLDITE